MKFKLFDYRSGLKIDQKVIDIINDNFGKVRKKKADPEMHTSSKWVQYAEIPNAHSLGLIITELMKIKSIMIKDNDGNPTLYLDDYKYRFQQR